jgi:hypothetical protein
MGPSWLVVPAELLSDDGRLRFWIDVAMTFNAQATPRPGRRSRTSARRPSDSRG